MGSFLFAGPTGVGKTEVTRQLAERPTRIVDRIVVPEHEGEVEDRRPQMDLSPALVPLGAPEGREGEPRHLERRQDPVAGGMLVQENHVARIFSADNGPVGIHLFQHVAITDRGHHMVDTQFF